MIGRRAAVLTALGACGALAAGCAGWPITMRWSGPRSRGIWIWSSEQLLASPATWGDLFAFSQRHGVGVLWTQVTTGRRGTGTTPGLQLTVSRAGDWRRFIATAHREGFTVDALDGDPTYADAAFHYVPLAIADAVIDFNRDGASAERFDGLHFDNEPYLLPGWSEPESRAQLVRDHLALNEEIQRRVTGARPLAYGIDLPFWWDADASARLLATVDSVTVMDYRNEASGPDGLVALATPLLALAGTVNHARVRVGVETRRFCETRAWFAVGPPLAIARATLGRSWRLRYPGDPFRVRTLEHEGRVHLGVALDGSTPGAVPPELLLIARDYGEREGTPIPTLAGNAEWRSVEPAPIVDSATGARYAGFFATNVPQAKLTFATRPEAFDEETSVAERAFRQFRAYRGLAVHDYEGLRLLKVGAR